MDKQERIDRLNRSYEIVLSLGKAHSKKEFADLVGVNRSSLSAVFNGNELYLTDNLIAKVNALVDSLQMDNMFPAIGDKPADSLLVIPTGARAGTLGDFAAGVKEYDCERMISPIKGADFAIQVTGDSMSPEYPNGSQVIIKKIDEEAFVEWGKVYVLDTENGAVIKQIRKTDDADVVECVSLNSAYQPFTINTKYIKGWYRVLMMLSLK